MDVNMYQRSFVQRMLPFQRNNVIDNLIQDNVTETIVLCPVFYTIKHVTCWVCCCLLFAYIVLSSFRYVGEYDQIRCIY